MPPSVDFQALKREIGIERVVEWLGIPLKKAGEQLRGCCPLCQGDNPRAFVVTPAKDLWYAFCRDCACGGDQLELVARLKGISVREAAIELQNAFASPVDTGALQPLDYLDPAHPSVITLGFPEEIAKALGIGYAAKGIMRGRVCIPLRTTDGRLVAYCGINLAQEPPLKLPSKFSL